MNGRPWTEADTVTLRALAGRRSASAIAQRTGHTERTIRAQMAAMGLTAYQADRARWTRRDWLLSGAAGLYYSTEEEGAILCGN